MLLQLLGVHAFFALLTNEALTRGSHTSIPQLRAAIFEHVDVHNDEGKPFIWTKTADEILDKVPELGASASTRCEFTAVAFRQFNHQKINESGD